MSPFDPEVIQTHTDSGWWDDRSIADMVRASAHADPHGLAFIDDVATITWAQYDEMSDRLAAGLRSAGCEPDSYLGVMLPDGVLVHVAFLAAEKAGLVILGIGPRTGTKEIAHILGKAGAGVLLTSPTPRDQSVSDLQEALRAASAGVDRFLTLILEDGAPVLREGDVVVTLPDAAVARAEVATRRLIGPNDVFCVNSTSGTTGVPKCVMQTMNIWKVFGPLAAEAGEFGPSETFMSLLPAPFGFGLWTGHIVPTMYGRPTVVLPEFDAEAVFAAIEREKVTVLAAVSSQFVIMLNHPRLGDYDLGSLRVMFTGGERVPSERAAEFEERVGCSLLQFYGSNEAGPISVTRISDSRENRLTTSGKVIPGVSPRLIGVDGTDVTEPGTPGQCACKGPGLTPGYLNDDAANAELFRPDGWLLTGDLATIDEDGYLRITGRVSDFIIRGGHNVSAIMIEDELVSHPRIAQVAAVAAPDAVLGERLCTYIVSHDGLPVSLQELQEHLASRGVSKNDWPEIVVDVPELPVAPGGKVRKSELRDDIARRLAVG